MEKDKENQDFATKERLTLLAKALHISSREFSRSIGKSGSYIASLRNDITLGVVNNILITYPHINLRWLVTGVGEIFNSAPLSEDLRTYVFEENKALKNEVKELLLEVGRLQGKIQELEKRNAQAEGLAECADAAI